MRFTLRHIFLGSILVSGALAMATPAAAQDYFDDNEPVTIRHKNEVKLNLTGTILRRMPEIDYEYIFRPDMTFGGRMSFFLGEKDEDNQRFMAMPYFRWYFTSDGLSERRIAKGFFAEVNIGVGSYTEILKSVPTVYVDPNGSYAYYEPITTVKKDSYWGIGAGIAAGWKYISHSGWTCDMFGGIGRNFSGNFSAYPVGGISIGKRF